MLPINNDPRSFSERQKQSIEEFDRRFNEERRGILYPRFGSRLSSNFVDSSFITDDDGKRKYQIRLNVKDFDAEDICVKVEKGLLIVEASRKGPTPEGSFAEKNFKKTVSIPPNVDSDTLVSTLSSDGILVIDGAVNDPPEYRSSCIPESRLRSIPGQKRNTELSSIPKESIRINSAVFRPINDPGVIDILGTKLWRLKLSTDPVKSEDIKISLNENESKLHFSATHVKVSDGCKSTNEYNREYLFPKNCDLDCIQAYVEQGILIVEAKLQDEYQPNRHIIDIDRV